MMTAARMVRLFVLVACVAMAIAASSGAEAKKKVQGSPKGTGDKNPDAFDVQELVEWSASQGRAKKGLRSRGKGQSLKARPKPAN
jgi:hypothetical protein